jgi:glycerol transport system ATP-binding protein
VEALRLEGVRLDFPGRPGVLDGIDLGLQQGEVLVVEGRSGSGKSSLLGIAAGLQAPTAGQVTIMGEAMDQRDAAQRAALRGRHVGLVFQHLHLLGELTLLENVQLPLRLAHIEKAEAATRARELLDYFGLAALADRRPAKVSGGEQQRTAIARALVKRAALVLMDEPLANLDYKLREELREELPKLFAESGSVFVYATTEPAEALLLGGRVATLSEGRVTQFGPAGEVFRRPADLATARVFSDPPLNEAPARLEGGRLALATGAVVPAPVGGLPEGPCTIGIRAHQLSLEPLPGAVALQAEVRVSEVTGSESYVHLDVGGLPWVVLAPGVRRPEPGEAATVWLDPQRCLVFGADGRLAAVAALAEAA